LDPDSSDKGSPTHAVTTICIFVMTLRHSGVDWVRQIPRSGWLQSG
jgi:hypothetical protein